MSMPISAWGEAVAPAFRAWWRRHGDGLLRATVLAMIAAALWRLGSEIPTLVWGGGEIAAFDLRLRHHEVHRWFAGLPVYDEVQRGDYPPASYVLLWPLLGWLTVASARWLWAASTLAALAWLALLLLRDSTASTRLQRLLILLLPFSVYPASATIRVGQLINHTLPLLLAGLLLLERSRGRWSRDVLAAALLLPPLVKPSLSVPFYWIVCFVPGRLRPILLVSLLYAALTLFAAAFQGGDVVALIQGWLGEQPQMRQGHANVHRWLALAGLREWALPVSLAILLALAGWVFRHRRCDLWVLLGVTAIVAHFWMHHRLYDDLLILLPMITLFRIARQGEANGSDVTAAILFALTWLTLHAPASVLGMAPPVSTLMVVAQVVTWLAVLVFLVDRAHRQRSGTTGPTVSSAERRLEPRSIR